MNPSSHVRRLVIPAFLLVFFASAAVHSQTATLSSLLSSGRYSEANQLAKKTNAATVISQVKPLAGSNNAPAQWILADAYWRNGQKEMSIQWGYFALVTTQLDGSVCRHRDLIAPWMQQSYEAIFREARRRPIVQAQAIKAALTYHAKRPTLPADKIWACQLGAYLAGDNYNTPDRAKSDETNSRRRKLELSRLIRKAELDIPLN